MNTTSFPIGPYEVPTGGIVVFFGVLLTAILLIRTVRDEEVSLKFLSDHLLLFVVVPLFLGRLGAFLSLWEYSQLQLPDTFFGALTGGIRLFLSDGGMQADWAMGGFFVVFFVLAFWRKEKSFVWLDTFILPGIALTIFVSLGGYFSGWGYGAPAPEWLPFPLSVEYSMQNVRYSGPLYAVQLYSMAFSFILFLMGWSLWRRKIWNQWPSGKFFAVMVFLLSVGHVYLEGFRGDSVKMIFDLRLPQVLGFCIAIASLCFLITLRDKGIIHRIKKESHNTNTSINTKHSPQEPNSREESEKKREEDLSP